MSTCKQWHPPDVQIIEKTVGMLVGACTFSLKRLKGGERNLDHGVLPYQHEIADEIHGL